MKNVLNNSVLLTASVLTVIISSITIYGAFNNNSVDENGQRQGYWVVTGAMYNDPDYSSNDVVEEGVYENDLKTGTWKKYYPSGQLRSEITYEQNKPNGLYTLYYENGVIEEKGNWARNKNVGTFSRNYSNGNPHQSFQFSDSGKRNGEQLYYHENGKLALQVNVVNGKEVGVMKRYDTKGELQEEKSFDNGSYLKGSTINHKKEKSDFIPEPAEIEKDSDVQPQSEVNEEEQTNAAHHFQPNGHNILYDQNKNISQSGIFKNGRLWNGKWYKYNKNGIVLRVDIYREGKFIGHGVLEEE